MPLPTTIGTRQPNELKLATATFADWFGRWNRCFSGRRCEPVRATTPQPHQPTNSRQSKLVVRTQEPVVADLLQAGGKICWANARTNFSPGISRVIVRLDFERCTVYFTLELSTERIRLLVAKLQNGSKYGSFGLFSSIIYTRGQKPAFIPPSQMLAK